GLAPRWTVTAKTAIGPPTVIRDEVYVVVDGTLERRTYGSAEVVWPKAGTTTFQVEGSPLGSGKTSAIEYPRPSVRGDAVFLATGRHLYECDRADGTMRRDGSLPGAVDPRTSRVAIGLADVLVACGKAFTEGDTARFSRPDGKMG